MNRKLAFIFGVFLTIIFSSCAVHIITAPMILVLLGISAFFAYFKFKNKLFIIMFVAGLCAFLFCIVHYNLIEKPVLSYIDKTCAVKAEIKKVYSSSFYTGFDLQVVETDGKKLNGFQKFKINITIYNILEAEIGDILEANISFKNLSGEDSNYYKSQGIYVMAEIAESEFENDEARIINMEFRGFTYHVHRLQTHVRETFFKYIKESYHDNLTQEAAVTYGIFTGVTDYISADIKNYFRRTGVGHILSVSGLHLTILAGICASALRLFNINKKISSIFIIIFSLLFAGFAGLSISAIRAMVMIILFYSAFLLERKSDSITSLVIAGFLIILPNPYHTINPGFQLSFCATFGIIFTQDFMNKITEKLKIKILKIIITSFFITLSAIIFTLPITAYHFQTLSLISLLTNIIVSPISYLVLFFALMLSLFSFINIPVILEIFGCLLYYCVKLLNYICELMSSFEYAYISTGSTINIYFYIFCVIFLTAIILLILFFKRKKFRKCLYIFASLAFILLVASQVYPRILFRDSVRFAYYSDYRNQNIILFHEDYNSADIIDMSHGTAAPVYETYNIIKENGAVNIRSIILTHYHRRHYNMISRYANYSNIKKVYVPEILNDYDEEVYNSLYYLSQRLGFELLQYKNALGIGDVLISRGIFEYDKMLHFSVDINYRKANLLYLGIGYNEGFVKHMPKLFDNNYDIVFYGSHKHNFRDDNYIAGIYANFAGVLSKYTNGNKEESSSNMTREVLEKYIERDNLYYISSNFYNYLVFAVNKNGNISQYFK